MVDLDKAGMAARRLKSKMTEDPNEAIYPRQQPDAEGDLCHRMGQCQLARGPDMAYILILPPWGP